MKKTITIDTGLVKVMPLEPTNAHFGVLQQHLDGDVPHLGAYRLLLKHTPAALPGVAEHSGEPRAYISVNTYGVDHLTADKSWCDSFESAYGHTTIPLFAHPPAQPDTAALQARIAELEAESIALHRKLAASVLDAQTAWVRYEGANKSRITTEAQLAAQAGQEPSKFGSQELQDRIIAHAITTPPAPANPLSIAQAALEAAVSYVYTHGAGHPDKIAEGIRAIDPQTIIDAARNK